MEFFVFALFAISWVVGNLYYSFLQQEKEKQPWNKLATSTGLRFLPGHFSTGGARLEGIYRGFSLSVHTVRMNTGNSGYEAYTIVRLTNLARQIPNIDVIQTIDVNNVESQFSAKKSRLSWGRFSLDVSPNALTYREEYVQRDVIKLKRVIDYLCDLAMVYPYVVSLGGEAVSFLHPIATNQNHTLKPLAIQLLDEIQAVTTWKFERLLESVRCEDCLTRFKSHEVKLGFLSDKSFYACRLCKNSRRYFYTPGLRLVLVLDNDMQERMLRHKNILLINWLMRRDFFDFDEVKIGRASDEDVAHFALTVGNDTDPFRNGEYKNMNCSVSANSDLSPNTIHILKRMFGRVKVEDTSKDS